MRLLQIVPGFGKTENALFDYAKVVAEGLSKSGIESIFDVEKVNECDAIFLNYVGYGYQKRGVSIRLLFKLWCWRKYKKKPIYTFFHELYAGGNHWITSSFWLYPLQKVICHALFNLSKCSFCSNEIVFNLLKSYSNDKLLYNVGLVSNIPTLQVNVPFKNRKQVALVFGTAERRQLIYSDATLLDTICKSVRIDKIIDIGDKLQFDFNIKTQIEYRGRQDKFMVASIMQECAYGFISYEDTLLAKSGVFAAYAGNGMVVINFHEKNLEAKDALSKNKHYCNARELENIQDFDFNNMSQNLYQWYQSHNLEKYCRNIAVQLMNEE